MRNILIVEGETDKYFLDAFVEHLNINTAEIQTQAVCRIDDYECMSGESLKKLIDALAAIKIQKQRGQVGKVGLILDQDAKTTNDKINTVNEALKVVFGEDIELLKSVGEFVSVPVDKDISLDFGVYFLNVKGQGNLETVLREIHTKEAIFADCLDAWQDCIERKEKTIKPSDFNKFWIQVYIRYDACRKKEQKQAGRKCNSEISMIKPIWNFNHECLIPLRTFLSKFD